MAATVVNLKSADGRATLWSGTITFTARGNAVVISTAHTKQSAVIQDTDGVVNIFLGASATEPLPKEAG